MNLGNTLRHIRKTNGIRQEDLAQLCDITPSYLSQIENNHKEPLLSTLKEIARHLGVPLPVIFFLALEEEDVPEVKRPVYKVLAPAMRSLIHEVFTVSNNQT